MKQTDFAEKREAARKRREALKDLSYQLKQLAKETLTNPGEHTVNDLLRKFYAGSGHSDLRTFNEWKEAGYHVRKGEKAILLWATPKPSKQSKEAAKSAGKDEEEAKDDFFPVAYLFSQMQVEAIAN